MSLWLTPKEIFDLTRYRQPTRQLAALRKMGVVFYVRPRDKKPVVPRGQFEAKV